MARTKFLNGASSKTLTFLTPAHSSNTRLTAPPSMAHKSNSSDSHLLPSSQIASISGLGAVRTHLDGSSVGSMGFEARWCEPGTSASGRTLRETVRRLRPGPPAGVRIEESEERWSRTQDL